MSAIPRPSDALLAPSQFAPPQLSFQSIERPARSAARLSAPIPHAHNASPWQSIFAAPRPVPIAPIELAPSPTPVQKSLRALPPMARDILASAMAKTHPFDLDDDEGQSLRARWETQRTFNERTEMYGFHPARPPQGRAPQGSVRGPVLLSDTELRSLQMCTELRLAYAALLAAHLPAGLWHSDEALRDETALLLAGSLLLTRKVTSDVSSVALQPRVTGLWRLGWGVGDVAFPTAIRLLGGEFADASEESLSHTASALERELLTWLHYDVVLEPEDVVAAARELHGWQIKRAELPRCEERFARRLFIEAYADIYLPEKGLVWRETIPKLSIAPACGKERVKFQIRFPSLLAGPLRAMAPNRVESYWAESVEAMLGSRFSPSLSSDDSEQDPDEQSPDLCQAPAMTRETKFHRPSNQLQRETTCPHLPIRSQLLPILRRCNSSQ